MNTKQMIALLGGPAKIIEDTGLSKGRISQWGTDDDIPHSWIKFYQLKRPDLPWDDYLNRATEPTAEAAP